MAIALQGQGNCRPILNRLAQHVEDPAWREVALLTVGYLGIIQQLDRVAGDVVDALVIEKPGKPGEAAILAGEAVLDAWPEGVPPASKVRVIDALVPTMQDAAVPAALRRQAGLLLGRLGWLPADLDAFVEVPASAFLYGNDKKRRKIPYRFWIGKYPVTNAQYGRFMADGGYDRREFWSEGGWAWRQGAEADLSALDNRNLRQAYESLLAVRAAAIRGEPFFWHDIERNDPIFPIVGITWFEAEAYATWLDGRQAGLGLGKAVPPDYVVRLPSEVEWELAARGTDGREYLWGNEFDFARANVAEEIGKGNGTTAVCTYPLGAGPTGAWDISGNVWEWTWSPWSTKETLLVVRGGSWYHDRGYARCAYRGRRIPDLFGGNLGFRVVVSLSGSGF